MNVLELLKEQVEKNPGRIALIHEDKVCTYGAFWNDVLETAAYLKSKGVGEGDRVLVFVPMSLGFYRLVAALFYIGAVAVVIEDFSNKERFENSVRKSGATIMVSGFKAKWFLKYHSKVIRNIPNKIGLGKIREGLDQLDLFKAKKESPALMTFTTGSTGMPKAVVRTHGLLLEQFNALSNTLGPKEGQVGMVTLPIVVLLQLASGSTTLIETTKPSGNMDVVIRNLLKYNAERIIASPKILLEISKEIVRRALKHCKVKEIITGGGPVYRNTAREIQRAFPEADKKVVYGSTEAEPISEVDMQVILFQENLLEGLPAGEVCEEAEVKIIRISNESYFNTDVSAIELPEGEVGEILVAGSHVNKSYLNGELAVRKNKMYCNNKVWHRTGDAGKLVNGKLYLFGRCERIIHVGNKTVFPFAIEAKLKSVPGIKEAAFIKVDNELILVLETVKKEVEPRVLHGIPFHRIWYTKIPVDKRHATKVDYSTLEKEYRNQMKMVPME